jgi:tetratricopeptide (TPR) repeat protein
MLISNAVIAAAVDPAKTCYLNGEKALKSGDVLSAAIYWQRALQIKPSSTYTAKQLSRIKPKLNKDQSKALELFNAAHLQVKENRLLEAVRTLQSACALQPKCKVIFDRMVEVANEESKHLTAGENNDVVTVGPSKAAPAKKTEKRARSIDTAGYLTFVESIERQRIALFDDTWINMEVADKPESLEEALNTLQGIINPWTALLSRFDSQAPAIDCDKFAQAYRLVLTTQIETFQMVPIILSQIREDNPSSFKWAQKQLLKYQDDPRPQQRIDQAVAAAERELKALCSKLKIAKNFSVQVESVSKRH